MKKFFLKLFLICTILGVSNLNVEAATNPYSKTSSFGVNCTWYAWQQAYDRAGIALPGWGNANTWLNYAKKAGYETGTTPRANSIVVWEWSSYGHVGYVEKTSNGKIYVWDSNRSCVDQEDEDYKTCLANSPSVAGDEECYRLYGKSVACEYDATYWKSPGDLIGYIYLDKIPISTNNNSNATNTNKNNVSTPKKSSNANLNKLSITDIPFEFNKDTLEYELVVNSTIENIKVEATTEDSSAAVEIQEEYQLNIGSNSIELIVTAEDGTKKTYTLNIYRKDNNAYLSSLSIDVGNIDFIKDTFNYEIKVSPEVQSITVEATSESNVAHIEGLGEYELNDEKTTITIKVIAEDENENIYTLSILKETLETPKVNKPNYIIIGVILIIIFITIITISLYMIVKRKHKKIKNDK